MYQKKINSMTLAAIFAAIYIIMSALSLAFPFLDTIILIIMPIFATYYSARFNLKEIILFNITTVLLCFLVTISDPFFSLLYIFPTLFVGDIFGLLYKKKVPYYTSFFILAITFVFTNLFSYYFTKIIYDIDLLKEIFRNAGFIRDFSLSFLLLFSMVEAFISQTLVREELKKFHFETVVEPTIPTYSYIINIILIILSVCFVKLFVNLYLCLFVLVLSTSSFSIIKFFKKIKYKSVFFIILGICLVLGAIPIIYYQRYSYLPLIILALILILQIVYLCQILYNYSMKSQTKIEKRDDK